MKRNLGDRSPRPVLRREAGLLSSTAFGIFARAVVRERAIPFPLTAVGESAGDALRAEGESMTAWDVRYARQFNINYQSQKDG